MLEQIFKRFVFVWLPKPLLNTLTVTALRIEMTLFLNCFISTLQKEKRMKEIQRSTNCILKKFQRQDQGNLLDHALFIAQVELKLVSRVLNMLKISTDQLIWCHEKLQKIKFSSGRKVEIEPSFTLFPC